MIAEQAMRDRIFTQIEEEYELTSSTDSANYGTSRKFWIMFRLFKNRSVLRNPYVDPLSYMQVQLLTELRDMRERGERMMLSCCVKCCSRSTELRRGCETRVDQNNCFVQITCAVFVQKGRLVCVHLRRRGMQHSIEALSFVFTCA